MGLHDKAIEVAIGQVRGFLYPSDAERSAAYELLVELSTRTVSAPLASTDGSIRESLDSAHELFGLTRRILREHGADASKGSGGNLSLAVIAVRVLNEVLRPVLSRWHPALAAHEARRAVEAPNVSPAEWETLWQSASRCRNEMNEMRACIRSYVDTLSRIAGAPAIADAVLSLPRSALFDQVSLDRSLDAAASDAGGPQPRQRMVRWLDVVEMFKTWRSGFRAHQSLRGADHRVDFDGLEPTATFDGQPAKEFWFDYMADMGDGFDGTAPIAWLAGRRHISIPDDPTGELPAPPSRMPRAELMVFGGDQIYPYAFEGGYESQLELPYRMGFEVTSAVSDHRPKLIAIPGNHDWLGGIKHFEAMFTHGRTFADHWATIQKQRFWHVKLPQGWWLWGIDTELHNVLPDEQIAYFTAAAKDLRAGDRVLVCTPVPMWQLRQKYREEYLRLRSILDPLIAGRGATAPLWLSGDSHFFAHFERTDSDRDEQHITAGGAGAFLQPTHNLPERIPLERGSAEFRMTTRWPRAADSRALAPGATRLTDRQYWPIIGVMGALYVGFAALLAGDGSWWRWWPNENLFDNGPDDVSRWQDTMLWSVGSWWGTLLLVVITLAGVMSLKGNSLEPKLGAGARGYGLLTGAALSASFVVVAAAHRFVDSDRSTWWLWVLVVVIGGALGLAVFLSMIRWSNGRIKAGDTLAFSPAHSTRFRHFLRCRIGLEGDLSVFVVGIDPAGQNWYRAMTEDLLVPPFDRAGIPRIHYVWGTTIPKFAPSPTRIALSISDPSPPPRVPLETVFNQMSEVLIDGGHTLMYGGRPGAGYTNGLRDVEVRRHADNPNHVNHLINYVADYLWPANGSADKLRDDQAMRSIHVERAATADESDEQRIIADLTAMRVRMTRDADVRIVVGGDLRPGEPGTRLAPGIVEEAYLAVETGSPLIVAGGFGGAAGLIAKAILGRIDPAELDALDRQFRRPAGTENGPGVGFAQMIERMDSLGVLRNGLTDGENRELLRSSDPDTVTALVWRSINRLASHRG